MAILSGFLISSIFACCVVFAAAFSVYFVLCETDAAAANSLYQSV